MAEEKKAPTTQAEYNARRNNYFGMILYPESNNHMQLLRYLLDRQDRYKICYIHHDKDRYDHDDPEGKFKKGDPEKVHIHLMYKTRTKTTAGAQQSYFMGYLEHVESISNPEGYVYYMLHDDFASINNEYKHKYDYSELQGNKELLHDLTGNLHFV